MLPEEADGTQPTSASMRYGSYAMEVLVNQLIKAGARRERLEAKVFGGGAVLPGMNSVNVGERNAAFVLRYLQMENIPIAAKDLMGDYPRKIYYFPRTGRALMKKMRSGQDIADQERDVIKKMRSEHVGGSVELFNKPVRRGAGPAVELFGKPTSSAVPAKSKVELFNTPVRKP
jgi:chemotaxis protein CheD